MSIKCLLCNKNQFKILWNDPIRSGSNSFTKNKEIIYQCLNCDLVFLKKKRKNLENSAIARNLYNNDNSIKEFIAFHKPREMKKLKKIEGETIFKNKKILESNCGAGVLLSILKKKSKLTAGIDDISYKNYLQKNGHRYFSSVDEIIKSNKNFDIILSLSELEHKFDPYLFLKKLKKILSKDGKLIVRIPNFNNIYKMFLGKRFYKYDFRTSHNYYFSQKNLKILFNKTNLKIVKEIGFQEYDINHLLSYIRSKKRVGSIYKKVLNKKDVNFTKNNIEKSLNSTSLIYILKKV